MSNMVAETCPGGILEVRYACAVCGKEAARLQLIRSSAPPPGFEGTVFSRGGSAALGTLRAEGAATPSVSSVREEDFAALAETLIKALSGFDPVSGADFTSSYCRKCNACYCKEHWQLSEGFSDFHDGDLSWHDGTYGICPKGHRNLLED